MSDIKPGDTCLVLPYPLIHRRVHNMRVTVLYPSPTPASYTLPDGNFVPARTTPLTFPARTYWICEMPIELEYINGNSRIKSRYSSFPEAILVPLRDPDAPVAETQDRTVTA